VVGICTVTWCAADVTTPEEARIAEEAGAVAVMALERIPSDIRKFGGVARMSDPAMIKRIQAAVTIPGEMATRGAGSARVTHDLSGSQ